MSRLYLNKPQFEAELFRCLNCTAKPCMSACPVNCSPQEFIQHAKKGEFKEAVASICKNNPMGHTCGLICPDQFCMKACLRGKIDFPINIPLVQATLISKYRQDMTDTDKQPDNGKKIAIVGAGPAGMAAACGARILDAAGRELPPGAEPLLRAKKVELSALKKQLKSVRIYAVADVTNPLLGPKSSAKVFGPQKGATPAQVKKLDKAMACWAQAVAAASGRDIARTPSTAAAGAIAAGLYGCMGAQLLLGADFLFQKAHLERYFDWADLVITTEGKLDRQTFYGKAPLAVLKLAQKHQKPVLFICGTLEERALKNQKNLPQQVAVLLDFAPSQTACLAHTARYLRQVVKNI